jgi:copper chaperone CopZ
MSRYLYQNRNAMNQTLKISGMTCSGCAGTVERVLKSVPGVQHVQVELAKAEAQIHAESHIQPQLFKDALSSYPSYQVVDDQQHVAAPPSFWNDMKIWKRASFNTLNCLIGCSIGDFAMIIFLQHYYPATSMMVQMILAVLAGLTTSVALETVILKTREGFAWTQAFKVAISMSFISMVAMEIAMNTSDFMITGGKAAFGNPMYWFALVVAMVAGFLVPLPYNYYKLKKFNKACH